MSINLSHCVFKELHEERASKTVLHIVEDWDFNSMEMSWKGIDIKHVSAQSRGLSHGDPVLKIQKHCLDLCSWMWTTQSSQKWLVGCECGFYLTDICNLGVAQFQLICNAQEMLFLQLFFETKRPWQFGNMLFWKCQSGQPLPCFSLNWQICMHQSKGHTHQFQTVLKHCKTIFACIVTLLTQTPTLLFEKSFWWHLWQNKWAKRKKVNLERPLPVCHKHAFHLVIVVLLTPLLLLPVKNMHREFLRNLMGTVHSSCKTALWDCCDLARLLACCTVPEWVISERLGEARGHYIIREVWFCWIGTSSTQDETHTVA